jgi:hypothetical protein
VFEPKCEGRGGVAGSQPISTAVFRSPNKLWRSNYIKPIEKKNNEKKEEKLESFTKKVVVTLFRNLHPLTSPKKPF